MLVGLVYQSAILVIGTKAGVYLVVVGGGIAMIGAEAIVVGRVVLEHRCEPQRRHAEFHEIVEVLAQSLQVTAMAQTGLATVYHIVIHALDLVVGIAATGEAVGHEHIEHVGIGETLALVTGFLPLLEFVTHALFLFADIEIERHHSWLRALEVEIDEQVVGTVEPHQTVDSHSAVVGRHLCLTDAAAINHELQTGVLHAGKPVGGFYVVDFKGCAHCCGKAKENSDE